MAFLTAEGLKCPGDSFALFKKSSISVVLIISSLSSPPLQVNGWFSWATTPGRVSSPRDSTAHCLSHPSTSRTCTRWTTASCSTCTPPVRLHPSAPISPGYCPFPPVPTSVHLFPPSSTQLALSPLVSSQLHLFQYRNLMLKKNELQGATFQDRCNNTLIQSSCVHNEGIIDVINYFQFFC